MSVETKRLVRPKHDRQIASVCSGLGEFFGIDPTLVRLVFILTGIFTAIGPVLLTYIILMITMPEEE